jgi:radical SAM superfamily enzyme YgiQ (UPF0313 family)
VQPELHEPPDRGAVLVGFGDQGNLGVGYLMAVLHQGGYRAEFVDIREGSPAIIRLIERSNPVVVGFSLIFQYYLPMFRDLISDLRRAGVRAHFTMGGHFPTLCYEDLLRELPELDSVVLFEGEVTLLELVRRLHRGGDWHGVDGIAFLNGTAQRTPLRPFVEDLDTLPHPVRHVQPEEVLGLRALPLVASRGCPRRCSFCSIHAFYRSGTGPVVRRRRPQAVVEEMRALQTDLGVRVFLFQDDDFPMWGRRGRAWLDSLVGEINGSGLADSVIWKISCRVDDVDEALFARLKEAGLYLVYLGLESGTEEGLTALNKQTTVEQNVAAVEAMKRLGLLFEFGFMLFDPTSTFESVRANVDFLRRIVGDGSAAATFCKMLPYGGTPIRDELSASGRLRGTIAQPDYGFADERLNGYQRALDRTVRRWIHGDGLSHHLNWAWHELGILERLFSGVRGVEDYRERLTALTRASNRGLLDLVDRTCLEWQQTGTARFEDASNTTARLAAELRDMRDRFVLDNQDQLLRQLARHGPIVSPQVH